MKHGYRVIDVDTHVNPSVEVLLRYADKDLRDRMDDLAPYIRPTPQRSGGAGAGEGAASAQLVVSPIRYGRVAGSKAAPPESTATSGHKLAGRTHPANTKPFSDGVSDDNAAGRLADMDTEGRDIDFIIPGTWSYGAPTLGNDLTGGVIRAYHRYMTDYCSEDPRRLKSLVLVSGADPEGSVLAIREYGNEDWAAAVWPVMPEGLPIDDPDLEPIWAAASELGLPIMYHGFHVEPPYFPGYRDVWDNPAMGRAAGQTWGGQRFISFMLMSGVLDRYPSLRIGTMECGHGWLPHWISRLGRQIDYVRGSVPESLEHTPAEYVAAGRLFCGIDFTEGVEMSKAVTDLLGDGVLMYQSDYPHPETIYPDHASTVIGWESTLGKAVIEKLMWENAARFLRLTSVPWETSVAASGAS